MFSSNQQLEISGSMEQLRSTIEFCLKHSGWLERFEDSLRPTIQVTKNNFCIGWGLDEVYGDKDSWQKLQFPYSLDLITTIVSDWLNNQSCEELPFDGSNHKGFIVRSIDYQTEDIKDSNYGIIEIQVYNCFYAK